MKDASIIAEKNPWWESKSAIIDDPYVKEATSRKNKILFKFEKEENLIFVGPRRVGKTTFFKLLIYDLLINKNVNPKDVLYISCEIVRDFSEILDVLRVFDAKFIFLDEITFVEGWEKAVKFALDQDMLKGKVLHITGSSTAFLKKETFPGRKIKMIPFLPMDFLRYCEIFGGEKLKRKLKGFVEPSELLSHFSEIYRLFMAYMVTGGFPKPALELAEEGHIREETYGEIFSWFRGDALKLGKSEEIMNSVVGRLLETLSTQISYYSIAGHVDVSHWIVREYIETLKALMYLDFCYQFDPFKKLTLFRKEKKFYFSDPFVVRTFEKKIIGRSIIDESKMAELIAFNCLKRSDDVHVLKRDGETDFLSKNKKFEVKWREKPKPRKGCMVLTKKEFHPDKNIMPLPLFLLWYPKSEEYRFEHFLA